MASDNLWNEGKRLLSESSGGLLCGLCVVLVCRLSLWLYSRRKYPPGPIGLPLLGYLPFLGTEPHKTVWEMRQRYGDIIGFYFGSKYTVVLNGYRVTKEVLCHPGALDRTPDLFAHLPDTGFITSNGQEWIEQRRFCMSSAKSLGLGRGLWEDSILEEIGHLTEYIRSQEGAPSDILHHMELSVASSMLSILIGRKITKEKEAETIEMSLEFSEAATRFTSPASLATLVPGLRKILVYLRVAGYDRAIEVIDIFRHFFRLEIKNHKLFKDYQTQDFINTYLKKLDELQKDGNKDHFYSENSLAGHLNLLYVAANDTTSSTVTWLVRLMAKHMDVQDRIFQELTSALGPEGKARYGDRHMFPYTFAVILEALRFSSNVPFSTTRRANRDIELDGYIIPKGADITSNLWGLHHDPEYWDRPHDFLPDRFLNEDGAKIINTLPSFAPFSLGKRDCPGQAVAYMTVIAYFTEIVKNFEISAPPGQKPEFKIINGLVNTLEPQQLCFKARK